METLLHQVNLLQLERSSFFGPYCARENFPIQDISIISWPLLSLSLSKNIFWSVIYEILILPFWEMARVPAEILIPQPVRYCWKPYCHEIYCAFQISSSLLLPSLNRDKDAQEIKTETVVIGDESLQQEIGMIKVPFHFIFRSVTNVKNAKNLQEYLTERRRKGYQKNDLQNVSIQ